MLSQNVILLLYCFQFIFENQAIDPCQRQPFYSICPNLGENASQKRSQVVLRFYRYANECITYPYGLCKNDVAAAKLFRYQFQCEKACPTVAGENAALPTPFPVTFLAKSAGVRIGPKGEIPLIGPAKQSVLNPADPSKKDLVKPGICPYPDIGEYAVCVRECHLDYECPDKKKCCFNGCGRLCLQPTVVDGNPCEHSRNAPDHGDCYGYFRRWWYDSGIDECKQFIYGGCGGSGNNFVSETECQKICVKKPTPPTAAPTPVTTPGPQTTIEFTRSTTAAASTTTEDSNDLEYTATATEQPPANTSTSSAHPEMVTPPAWPHTKLFTSSNPEDSTTHGTTPKHDFEMLSPPPWSHFSNKPDTKNASNAHENSTGLIEGPTPPLPSPFPTAKSGQVQRPSVHSGPFPVYGGGPGYSPVLNAFIPTAVHIPTWALQQKPTRLGGAQEQQEVHKENLLASNSSSSDFGQQPDEHKNETTTDTTTTAFPTQWAGADKGVGAVFHEIHYVVEGQSFPNVVTPVGPADGSLHRSTEKATPAPSTPPFSQLSKCPHNQEPLKHENQTLKACLPNDETLTCPKEFLCLYNGINFYCCPNVELVYGEKENQKETEDNAFNPFGYLNSFEATIFENIVKVVQGKALGELSKEEKSKSVLIDDKAEN